MVEEHAQNTVRVAAERDALKDQLVDADKTLQSLGVEVARLEERLQAAEGRSEELKEQLTASQGQFSEVSQALKAALSGRDDKTVR